MAAYAHTTTLDLPKAQRISRDLGLIIGQCNLSNYNATKPENTVITDRFTRLVRVVCSGTSVGGFPVVWDATAKAFKAFIPTGNKEASAEADEDTNVGIIHFVAIGTL